MTAAPHDRLMTPPFYALTPFIVGAVSLALLAYGSEHLPTVIRRLVPVAELFGRPPPPTAPLARQAATVLPSAAVAAIWQGVVLGSILLGFAGFLRAVIDAWHLTVCAG